MKNHLLILMTASLLPAMTACKNNGRNQRSGPTGTESSGSASSSGYGSSGGTTGSGNTSGGAVTGGGTVGGGDTTAGGSATGSADKSGGYATGSSGSNAGSRSGALGEVDTARADATAMISGRGLSAPNGVASFTDRADGVRVNLRVTNAPKGTYTVAVADLAACPWSSDQGGAGTTGAAGTGEDSRGATGSSGVSPTERGGGAYGGSGAGPTGVERSNLSHGSSGGSLSGSAGSGSSGVSGSAAGSTGSGRSSGSNDTPGNTGTSPGTAPGTSGSSGGSSGSGSGSGGSGGSGGAVSSIDHGLGARVILVDFNADDPQGSGSTSGSSDPFNMQKIGTMTVGDDGIGRFDSTLDTSKLTHVKGASDLTQHAIVLKNNDDPTSKQPVACGSIMSTRTGAGT